MDRLFRKRASAFIELISRPRVKWKRFLMPGTARLYTTIACDQHSADSIPLALARGVRVVLLESIKRPYNCGKKIAGTIRCNTRSSCIQSVPKYVRNIGSWALLFWYNTRKNRVGGKKTYHMSFIWKLNYISNEKFSNNSRNEL